MKLTDRSATWLVFVFVSALAFLRMSPVRLEYEEPQLLGEAGTQDLWSYVVAPQNGAVQWFGRAAFVVAYPFGDGAALVTRLIAAAVIGAVGAYLFGRREAIPDRRIRLILAVSLPLYPIPDPGPYIGPLNSQWWFAIGIAGMALSPVRRWHYPALLLGGLSGIGPCLLWPAFRDRRFVVLLITAIVQASVLLASPRRPQSLHVDAYWLALVLPLCASLLFARLPVRTRAVFLYAGVAVLTVGVYAMGTLVNQGRYLAIPWAGFVLGVASFIPPAHPSPTI